MILQTLTNAVLVMEYAEMIKSVLIMLEVTRVVVKWVTINYLMEVVKVAMDH